MLRDQLWFCSVHHTGNTNNPGQAGASSPGAAACCTCPLLHNHRESTVTCDWGPHQVLSWPPPDLDPIVRLGQITKFIGGIQESTASGVETNPAWFCVVQSIFHTCSYSCSYCAFFRGAVSYCTCPLQRRGTACRSRADHGSGQSWQQTGPQHLEFSI